MYKLLHIHSNIIFIDHSKRYIHEKLHNEILFIGKKDKETALKLDRYDIKYTIFDSSTDSFKTAIEYANTFDGVIFHCLYESSVQILFKLDSRVKTFLKFFGQELYMLNAKEFLSEKTLVLQPKMQESLFAKLKAPLGFLKRKLKIFLNREFHVGRDNQKKVYEKFDAILIINKYEYDDLHRFFYLPKLLERQLVDQEQELSECRVSFEKLNKILIGNSGHRWNNHLEVLDIVKSSKNIHNVEFKLFFSYGYESRYAQNVKSEAQEINNLTLIETFLAKEEFEKVYIQAAALVINSYRQHAIGNILTAIQNGCKIYLNKKSSTFHWLISKGFLISEVDDLKKDIELGNIKLSAEEQQKNIDCFVTTVNNYSVSDFLNNVISVLKG